MSFHLIQLGELGRWLSRRCWVSGRMPLWPLGVSRSPSQIDFERGIGALELPVVLRMWQRAAMVVPLAGRLRLRHRGWEHSARLVYRGRAQKKNRRRLADLGMRTVPKPGTKPYAKAHRYRCLFFRRGGSLLSNHLRGGRRPSGSAQPSRGIDAHAFAGRLRPMFGSGGLEGCGRGDARLC